MKIADRAWSHDARGSVKSASSGMIPEPTGTTAITTDPYDIVRSAEREKSYARGIAFHLYFFDGDFVV